MNFIKRFFGSGDQPDYPELLLKGALIVDVRSAAEFNSGHIKSSINIPLDALSKHLPELKLRKKQIITVCRSGNRSAIAKGILQAAGIATINGGAWDILDKKITPDA